MSLEQKRCCIEPEQQARISVRLQCELIGLPRSSYYRQPVFPQETEENLLLMRLIDQEYTDHPFYGSRQMRNYLPGMDIESIGNGCSG